MAHQPTPPTPRQKFLPFLLVLTIGIAVGFWIALEFRNTQAIRPTVPAPTHTPQPWEYDEDNDRFWHAENGHGHWHQGPPPPPDQRY